MPYLWQEIVDELGGEPSSDWRLFIGRPRAEDLRQGSLGVCWLLSAMTVLSQRDGMVERLFVNQKASSQGVYQVSRPTCSSGSVWHCVDVLHRVF